MEILYPSSPNFWLLPLNPSLPNVWSLRFTLCLRAARLVIGQAPPRLRQEQLHQPGTKAPQLLPFNLQASRRHLGRSAGLVPPCVGTPRLKSYSSAPIPCSRPSPWQLIADCQTQLQVSSSLIVTPATISDDPLQPPFPPSKVSSQLPTPSWPLCSPLYQ